jgi:hypothetical protein
VKQTLRFSYEDLAKISDIVAAIKMEIKKTCPALITDGSRPFRVHFKDFQPDHLEVGVDCHFDLPPMGNVFWENRQEVLLAISKATQCLGVQFAVPNFLAKNVDVTVSSLSFPPPAP